MARPNDAQEYDIVIIGAGPSSIGLIYGLLLPYDNVDTTTSIIPDFTIAVIERGTTMKTPTSPDVRDPKNWYRAAHPSSMPSASKKCFFFGGRESIRTAASTNNTTQNAKASKTNNISCTSISTPASVAVEYETTPQQMLGNRILSVPTGKGLGGGTNINACLVVRPSEDDFIHWPKKWTEEVNFQTGGAEGYVKMSQIMSSVVHIENEMRKNGALEQENYSCNGSQDQQWRENRFEFQQCNETGQDIEFRLSSVTNAVKKENPGNNVCETHPGGANHTNSTCNKNKKSCDAKHFYRRVNYYEAILEPLLDRNPHFRSILTFHIGVQAERLLFDDHNDDSGPHNAQDKGEVEPGTLNANGVECSRVNDARGRSFCNIMATNVVLSAGAILSPALLLASGIGNEEDLKTENIQPLITGSEARPNNQWDFVGKRLRDHLVTASVFLTLKPLQNINGINSVKGWISLDIEKPKPKIAPASTVTKEYMNDPSLHSSRVLFKIIDGSSSSVIVPGAVRSMFHREYTFKPQNLCRFINLFLRGLSSVLAFVLNLVLNIPPINWILSTFTYQVLVCLLNPDSMGSVKIRRKCLTGSIPTESRLSDFDLRIDPSYLNDERDIGRIKLSWSVLNRIAPTWLSGSFEILPGVLYRWAFRDKYLKRYLSDSTLPYYHYSGSCGMNYVVDENLRVRGTSNLYICDASVLIEPLSGPPALALAGLGFTASRFIQKQISGKFE
jgi:choline dehydrogenase-like flavoprotein